MKRGMVVCNVTSEVVDSCLPRELHSLIICAKREEGTPYISVVTPRVLSIVTTATAGQNVD